MENLWAPWRMDYVLGKRLRGCIFCPGPDGQDDQQRLILYRGERALVMLNRFPYTNGHLLVAPWKHTPALEGLGEEELLALFKTVRRSVAVLKTAMSPDGFNVGLNLGMAAGAGVEAHVHVQVVPRWIGDTNFMTVFGEARVISEHLQQTYLRLLPYFAKERVG